MYIVPSLLRFNLGLTVPGVPVLVEGRVSGLPFADGVVGMPETV